MPINKDWKQVANEKIEIGIDDWLKSHPVFKRRLFSQEHIAVAVNRLVGVVKTQTLTLAEQHLRDEYQRIPTRDVVKKLARAVEEISNLKQMHRKRCEEKTELIREIAKLKQTIDIHANDFEDGYAQGKQDTEAKLNKRVSGLLEQVKKKENRIKKVERWNTNLKAQLKAKEKETAEAVEKLKEDLEKLNRKHVNNPNWFIPIKVWDLIDKHFPQEEAEK